MNETPLWKLEHVTLTGVDRPRLDDVSLEVRPGVTAVVGYSGAGKTSLLNVLVGFERPDAGTVRFAQSGRLAPRVEPPLAERADDSLPLFWVPPNDGLWPHLTAVEHLETVMARTARAERSSRRADAKEAGSASRAEREGPRDPIIQVPLGERDLLDAFDLADQAGAYPERLSQGERARLSVARALASGAAVLAMDEPLVHVDPARVGRYWQVVREHCAATGASLVFSTHAPETVLREAERAVCLHEGRVVYAGTVEDLYYRPASPELASFLGAANWFTAEEVRRWLGRDSADEHCYRPEQIAIHPAEESPLVVEGSRFAGSVAEVELSDERTRQRKTLFHRPAGDRLRAGEHVVVKVCLVVLLLLGLVGGCNDGAAGPALEVARVDYWSMPPDGPRIPAPRAMTVNDKHELFVLDNAGRVLVFNKRGELVRQWHMPEYDVGNPEGICIFRDGRIAIADTHYHRIVFFDQSGTLLGMQGEKGEGPGQFIYPESIAQDADGNFYVVEYGGNDRVQKFAPDGSYLLEFGGHGTGPGEFQRPSGIVWHDGRVYVADSFNNRLQVFSDSGEFVEILGAGPDSAGLHYPYDLAQSAAGDLFVVEFGAGRISKLSLDGTLLGRYGTVGSGDGELYTPWGLTIDGDSRLFVADTGNRRIVELEL